MKKLMLGKVGYFVCFGINHMEHAGWQRKAKAPSWNWGLFPRTRFHHPLHSGGRCRIICMRTDAAITSDWVFARCVSGGQ